MLILLFRISICVFLRATLFYISYASLVGLPSNSYKPITNAAWVRARLCKLQKGCTRLAAASDKVYQLLAHGRWFSPGTPASSTTKTGRHDIAEILLKVALNTINQIKSLGTINFLFTGTSKWPQLISSSSRKEIVGVSTEGWRYQNGS